MNLLTCLWGWLLGFHNGGVQFEIIIFNNAIQTLVWRQTGGGIQLSGPPPRPHLPSPSPQWSLPLLLRPKRKLLLEAEL